jgi:hypothetical protein
MIVAAMLYTANLVRAGSWVHAGVTALARQYFVAGFWRIAAYQLNMFAL